MALAYSRRKIRGGADIMIGADKATGTLLPGQESSLPGILPVTTWGYWSNYPGALAMTPQTQLPPPLANGGLYTGPQSTGEWSSKPFPATQYGMMAEATKLAGNPDVFYQQRPNDNTGASFSPFVSVPLSPQHYSAAMPAPLSGGRRKAKTRRAKRSRKLSRRHK